MPKKWPFLSKIGNFSGGGNFCLCISLPRFRGALFGSAWVAAGKYL
jgi:hypothetical protein